jgi:hypothetical protein
MRNVRSRHRETRWQVEESEWTTVREREWPMTDGTLPIKVPSAKSVGARRDLTLRERRSFCMGEASKGPLSTIPNSARPSASRVAGSAEQAPLWRHI